MSVELSYESLGQDGLAEIVDQALVRILDNIEDPNTDYKPVREIKVSIKLKPDKDRKFPELSYSVTTKPAPVAPVTMTAMVADGTLVIPQLGSRPNQHELPMNVTPIRKEAHSG